MRSREPLALALLVEGIFLLVPLLAYAGGSITGKVTFSGTVPPPKEFALSKFPNTDFCKQNPAKSQDGGTRLLHELAVAKDGGLKNAIVSVQGIKDKNWLKSEKLVKLCESSPHIMAQACAGVPRAEVVVELCEFAPQVGVVVNGGKVYVENHDADPEDPKSAKGVLHSPHGFEVLGARSSTLFNIPLAAKGDSLNKEIRMTGVGEGAIMRLQCDQHEFMQAWFLPVANPYYARVSDEGTFEINNVPPGRQKILAWHPVAGKVEATVDVPDGGTVEVHFDMK